MTNKMSESILKDIIESEKKIDESTENAHKKAEQMLIDAKIKSKEAAKLVDELSRYIEPHRLQNPYKSTDRSVNGSINDLMHSWVIGARAKGRIELSNSMESILESYL